MKKLFAISLIAINLALIAFIFLNRNRSEIVLKDVNGQEYAFIGLKDNIPTIELRGLELRGGDAPIMRVGSEHSSIVMTSKDLSLCDGNDMPRFQMMGSPIPALFLRDERGGIVGTLISMEDGGAGLGLADQKGNIATYLRGGENPSLNFFQNSENPIASIGVTKSVPHLILLGQRGKEGMIMHAGSPTSLIFINEEGKIPVILSKYGLYQEKVGPVPPKKEPEKTITESYDRPSQK